VTVVGDRGGAFNLAQVHAAVAAANPDRDCIVWRGRRFTFAQTDERARRLAQSLHTAGLGAHRERAELAGHESGQDRLALYMTNCNEYLEGMLGAYKARVAPFNVNYRYVTDELVYLLTDAGPAAVMYHASFAPALATALERVRAPRLLIHVDDDSGNAPVPGALRYEDLLASASPDPLDIALSPDDVYLLYTGGTTGMPKGVQWRQHDIYLSAMGGRTFGTDETVGSLEQIVERSRIAGGASMTAAPLMHGAAQWSAFTCLCAGRTFVLPAASDRFDAAEALATASREKVMSLQIIGDAFARPIIDALEAGHYDLSEMLVLISGGAALTAQVKQRFLELVPHAMIIDAGGSSEAGAQMGHVSTNGNAATGRFSPNPDAVVVSADLTRSLSPGDPDIGWLAQRGYLPLGYLGDAAKTALTFPVIQGIRHAVPGDRARWCADGTIELLGRDSVTINSGGEKIFAEEVEAAIASHPGVYDVVVVGRPSQRWGSEVVALVQLAPGVTATADEILTAAQAHIARYKLPKAVLFRSHIRRSPAGKADYRWAAAQAKGDPTAP
jgi:acyl-CoA synthetase (AMP-forming)/AMP-acid ligase II